MARVGAQSFNGLDVSSNSRLQRKLTGPDGSTIDVYRAGPALGDTTTELRPGHTKMIAQHPQQRRRWISIDRR